MTSILKEFKIFNYFPKTIKYEIKCFYVTSDSEFAYCVTNDDQVYGVGKDVHKILNYKESDQDNYVKITELFKLKVIDFFEDKNNHGMFARTLDNQIYGWGLNRFGLLKSDQDYCRPQLIEYFKNKNIVQIDFGENYYLALSSDNIIYGQGTIIEEWRRLKEIFDNPDNEKYKYFHDTFDIKEVLASSKIQEKIKTIYCFNKMAFVVTIELLVYCSSMSGWRNIPKLSDVCKVQMSKSLVIFLRKNGIFSIWDDHERKWMEYYLDSNITDICVIKKGIWSHQFIFEDHGEVVKFTGFHAIGPDPYSIRKTKYKTIFEYNLFDNQVTHQTIFIKKNAIEYQGALQTKTITIEEFFENKKQNLKIRKELKNFRLFNAFPKNVRTGVKCFYQSADYSSEKYLAFYVTNDDHVYCLGNNDYGKLGLQNNQRIENYTEIEELYNQGIEEFFDAGSCMFARNNSNKLFAWGVNLFSKLLINDPEITFVKPVPFIIGDEKTEIVHIEHCKNSCLALTSKGQLYGWGNNDFMQICHDHREEITEPTRIFFSDSVNEPFIKFIHCYHDTQFAVTVDGKVFVWGAPTCGIDPGPKLLEIKNVDKVYTQIFAWLFLKTDKSVEIFDTKTEMYRSINFGTKVKDIFIYYSPDPTLQKWNTTIFQTDEYVLEYQKQDQILDSTFHNFYDYFLQKFKTTLGTIHINSEGYILVKNINYNKYSHGGPSIIIEYNNIYQDKFNKYFNIDDKTFYDQGVIGEGSFGKVFRVFPKNKQDKQFAIKEIDLFGALSYFGDINYIFEEIRVMTKVKSEFVVNYADSWMETKMFKKYVYIQMELLPKSLIDIIKLMRSAPETDLEHNLYIIRCELFKQLIKSLGFLHSETNTKKQIIHRDLKPGNVLISDGRDGPFVKLCDFGLSKILDNTVFIGNNANYPDALEDAIEQNEQCQKKVFTQKRGTIDYMAPEVRTSTNYNTKSDIFSLALIAGGIFGFEYDPVRLKPRRIRPNNLKRYREVYKNQDIREKFQELLVTIEKCLYTHDFNDRPDCEELLELSSSWTIEQGVKNNIFNEFLSEPNNSIFKLILDKLLTSNQIKLLDK